MDNEQCKFCDNFNPPQGSAQCHTCDQIKLSNFVINKEKANGVYARLCEVRAGESLACKLSKYVHDNCKDVPHDIGLKLIDIVREHFV